MTFLALRSYLPADHPDKGKEIGSEPTPAAFLDTMLALTAEWSRLLAPHGSICVELGDTYAGSGGAGGDYGEDGLRDGQPRYKQSNARKNARVAMPDGRTIQSAGIGNGQERKGPGWPLDKSLCGIPDAYALSLEYGRNILRAPLSARELLAVAVRIINDADDGQDISATSLVMALQAFLTEHEERGPAVEYERWRVRNKVAWVRPNPPVGALGDKFRPATSYLTIATRARDRYFDLDAVRTPHKTDPATYTGNGYTKGQPEGVPGNESMPGNPAGAPPLDWWNHVDLLIDDEIAQRAGRPANGNRQGSGGVHKGRPGDNTRTSTSTGGAVGAQGSHIRRRLEQAGYFGGPTDDVWDIPPSGFAGAHYAVYPPELCTRPILTMTPRRVCTTCGQPSRRIVEVDPDYQQQRDAYVARRAETHNGSNRMNPHRGTLGLNNKGLGEPTNGQNTQRRVTTVGWSDCGHDTWRPGHVFDPFAGTGTTLAVATGHAREATGIDLDPRNAELAQQRVGMFLTIDHGTQQETA